MSDNKSNKPPLAPNKSIRIPDSRSQIPPVQSRYKVGRSPSPREDPNSLRSQSISDRSAFISQASHLAVRTINSSLEGSRNVAATSGNVPKYFDFNHDIISDYSTETEDDEIDAPKVKLPSIKDLFTYDANKKKYKCHLCVDEDVIK